MTGFAPEPSHAAHTPTAYPPRMSHTPFRFMNALPLALALLSGCDRPAGPPPRLTPFETTRAAAEVAFAEAELSLEGGREDEGVRGGEGDEAGERSEPVSSRPLTPSTSRPRPRPRTRVLLFTASWCVACRRCDATLAALRRAGWRVGPGDDAHVRVVDVDRDPAAAKRFAVTAVPTWVRVVDGEETRRVAGSLGPFAVGDLWHGRGGS